MADELLIRSTTGALFEANMLLHAPDGFTPLGLAVFFRHAELAQRLLDAGADAGLKDEAGRDAAEHARQHGHAALAEALGH